MWTCMSMVLLQSHNWIINHKSNLRRSFRLTLLSALLQVRHQARNDSRGRGRPPRAENRCYGRQESRSAPRRPGGKGSEAGILELVRASQEDLDELRRLPPHVLQKFWKRGADILA